MSFQGKALEDAIKTRAAEIVANWPPLTAEQRYKLRRILEAVEFPVPGRGLFTDLDGANDHAGRPASKGGTGPT